MRCYPFLCLLTLCLSLVLMVSSHPMSARGLQSRQKPVQLSEKLLKMLNDHFHTFGRPRFGKRASLNHDTPIPVSKDISSDLWDEDFEVPLHISPPYDSLIPELVSGASAHQRSDLLRRLLAHD
uniref:Ghrelin n=1 Tax=Mesocestoides corti TaxID=53468 RepID=A0A5K3F3M3_MESCO